MTFASERRKPMQTQGDSQIESLNLINSPEVQLEPEDNMISLDRGMRDLRHTDLIDKMRSNCESLTPVEKEQIVNSLERRKWGGVLRNLEKGDTVISILSSTSDLLTIKNLNDNVFGSQTTDSIIARRRQLTNSSLNLALNVAGVTVTDLEHISLEQNYKFGIYKIPGKYNIDAQAIANKICAEVDLEMKKYIIELADDEQTKNPTKTEFLQNFRGAVNQEGYKMTFGIATVDSDDLEDTILAINGSLQTARAVAVDNPTDYGDQFSPEKMTTKIDQISELRDKIRQDGNKITGIDEINYEIFVDQEGKIELNRDLLRDVRKDKFVCQPGQAHVLKDIKNYIKSLNIFDIVKPFTADEVKNLNVEMDEINLITPGILSDDQKKCINAADILDRNEKDTLFTSEARFHAEAVKIKNCAYLNLDVLDVGVEQLLDFEQRAQMVAAKKITFAQASLQAGDLMTHKLRTMRERVFNICNEFNLTKDGRMNGLVGGDELTIAIDMDEIDENSLNQLIYRLKKETNSRVVKTVISESQRHSSTENIVSRMKEHLLALKNAETGTGQAKLVENELRKLDKIIKERPGNELAASLLDSLKYFVVTEVDGNFVIRTETGPDMSLHQVLEKSKFFYK